MKSFKNYSNKVIIYPAISKDGIGTYIESLKRYLNFTTVKSDLSVLSIKLFFKKLDFKDKILHVPNFYVPFFTYNNVVITTIQDVIPIFKISGFNFLQRVYFYFRISFSIWKSDFIIFTSKSTKMDVEKWFLFLPQSKIIPLAPSEVLASGQIKFVEYPFQYIFSVGRRRYHKNTHGLIRALKTVRETHDIHLLFSGTKTDDDLKYLQLARELGVENYIHFTGFLDNVDLAAHYRSASSLVFPSLYEGFGLPVLEAMSLDCPVITSNTSSLPEISGDASVLVDPFNIDAIADAICEVHNNKEFRNYLIYKGQVNVKEYNWYASARMTSEVYDKFDI
jgi:glycosyltransferase involved in cell wall biosynthesis